MTAMNLNGRHIEPNACVCGDSLWLVPEPFKCCLTYLLLFFQRDGFSWASELSIAPRFHFYEDDGVVFEEDEIDLPIARVIVVIEEGETSVHETKPGESLCEDAEIRSIEIWVRHHLHEMRDSFPIHILAKFRLLVVLAAMRKRETQTIAIVTFGIKVF